MYPKVGLTIEPDFNGDGMRSAIIFLALSAIACTNNVAPADAVVVIDDSSVDSAVTYATPADVDTEHLYLGVDNAAFLTTDAPLFYGAFDMLPRGKVDIIVTNVADPEAVVGFKVYRVNPRGTLRYLGQVDDVGAVGARLQSRAGGTFVVEATTDVPDTGAALSIRIDCRRRDGGCGPLAQPGALCGTRGAGPCDDGLFCQIEEGCGRTDGGGTCTIPSQICPAVACREVCGCDAVTYCDACHAHAVGANVDFAGACEVDRCDPSVWQSPRDGSFVEVMGTWVSTFEQDGFDVKATLHVNDGDFLYEQTWDPTCLHEPPYCRRASLTFSMTGGWVNQGFAIQLLPDADSLPAPDRLAQSFSIETQCAVGPAGDIPHADVRLTTTELSVDRVFTRDRCADVDCEPGTHCELVEVQCIAAPCFPVPSCVAD